MKSCYIRINWEEIKLLLIVRKSIIYFTRMPHSWINHCFLTKNEKLHIIQESLNFLLIFTFSILVLSFLSILTFTYHYNWLNEFFLPPRTLDYGIIVLGKAKSIGVPRLKLILSNVRCIIFMSTFLQLLNFEVWAFGVIIIAILHTGYLNVIIV